MDETHALFANDTFYLDFNEKDIEAMDRLWANLHPVICIHPGWPALTERAEIIESWRKILQNPTQPGIDFYNPVAHAVGGTIIVTCYEEIGGGVCIATNGFVEEAGVIKLFHHHAGPCSYPPPATSARQS